MPQEDKQSQKEAISSSLPFITTSDVLNQLKKNLKELAMPGEESLEPRFELQKRLPDGSTIPASEADLSASDLQNKLQQSAKFVSQLKPSDKQIWAEQQRLSGNVLFQRGEYKAAMDVYLTCLVVKETSTIDDGISFLSQTLIPVLNNLAQCTLQLGMQKKTIEFCNIALEEISKATNDDTKEKEDKMTGMDPIAICKIYFKRAKAQRLTGHYFEAREDLNKSLEQLEAKRTQNPDDIEPFHRAIMKEFRYLEKAEKEARKNKQKQKQAMRKALAKDTINSQDDPIETVRVPRQYSMIRARTKSKPMKNSAAKREHTKSKKYPIGNIICKWFRVLRNLCW